MADEESLDELIPRLLRQLEDLELGVSEYASRDLERIGEPAVTPLIALLSNRAATTHARWWAARALGHIGDTRAYASMVSALTDTTEDIGVRKSVAFYLGRLGDPRATVPLIEVMMNQTEPVDLRKNATYALGELGDADALEALLEMLSDKDVGNIATHALEKLRDPRAAAALLPLFASDDERLRHNAAVIVGRLGTWPLDALLTALGSGDWRVRWAAATALGFTNSERAVAPLITTLQNDADAAVRTQAASALYFSAEERVVGALTRALVQDKDVRVRQASVHTLFELASQGQVGAEILPALEIAAHDAETVEGHRVVGPIAQKIIDRMKL